MIDKEMIDDWSERAGFGAAEEEQREKDESIKALYPPLSHHMVSRSVYENSPDNAYFLIPSPFVPREFLADHFEFVRYYRIFDAYAAPKKVMDEAEVVTDRSRFMSIDAYCPSDADRWIAGAWSMDTIQKSHLLDELIYLTKPSLIFKS